MDKTFNIFINGERLDIHPDAPLESILKEFGAVSPFAILINQHFIPASQHAEIKLNANDHIEIISAIQGG